MSKALLTWIIEGKPSEVPAYIWRRLDDEQLDNLYDVIYDRWNFETGSDEDFELMTDVLEEIQQRDNT